MAIQRGEFQCSLCIHHQKKNTMSYGIIMYVSLIVFYAIISTYLPSPFKFSTSLFLLSVTTSLRAILPSRSVMGNNNFGTILLFVATNLVEFQCSKDCCVLLYYPVCMFYYALCYYISTYFLSPLTFPTSLFLLWVIAILCAILPCR